MKCLVLEGEHGSLCVPISQISAVSIAHLGVVDGKMQWVVCVAYAGEGEWCKYYIDPESATKQYNRLVEALMNC